MKIKIFFMVILAVNVNAQNWGVGVGPVAIENIGKNVTGNVNFGFPVGDKFGCAISYWNWRGTDSNFTYINNLITDLKANFSSTPSFFYGNEALTFNLLYKLFQNNKWSLLGEVVLAVLNITPLSIKNTILQK